MRDAEPQGQRVILWLFVALAAATALGLWMFSLTPEGMGQKPAIARALAGDLAIPAMAWFILKGIGDRGHKWRWWGISVVAAALAYGIGAAIFVPLFR